MRKLLLSLALILGLANLGVAQDYSGIARRIRWAASAPSTCNPNIGDVYWNTTSDRLFACTATNTWTEVGTVPSTAVKFPDGTVSAPGIAFADDTNTGFYRIGADNIGVSLGGVIYGNWSTDGLMLPASKYLNYGTTAGTSGYGLRDNAGTVEFKNNAGAWAAIAASAASAGGWTDDGTNVRLDTGTDTVSIGTVTADGKLVVRQDAAADILNLMDGTTIVVTVLDGGNVGIGTTGPAARLTVKDAGTGLIQIGQMSDVTSYGAIGFGSALSSTNYVLAGNGGDTLLNAVSGSAIKLRVANSDVAVVSTGTFYVDGNVGIGAAGPSDKLEVNGNVQINNATGQLIFNPNTASRARILLFSNTYGLGIDTTDLSLFSNNGFTFHSASVTGTSLMRVTTLGGLSLGPTYIATDPGAGSMIIEGNVGIGTTTPGTLLHVNGATSSTSYQGTAANQAAAGVYRQANNTAHSWRDPDNAADMSITGSSSWYWTFAGTRVITGAVADGYAGSLNLAPTYNAATAQTVTRHNYINLPSATLGGVGPAALTDAAVFRFDAAVGTHKSLASPGVVAVTLGTGPTGANAGDPLGWLKINVSGTLRYIPFW